MRANDLRVCCICGYKYVGYGNNAEPVAKGRCCDDCNLGVVIPTRLMLISRKNKNK